MCPGLTEFIWERQRETGAPVSTFDLAPFFNCSHLAVPGRMKEFVRHPIYRVWLTDESVGMYVMSEDPATYYSTRSNDATYHG